MRKADPKVRFLLLGYPDTSVRQSRTMTEKVLGIFLQLVFGGDVVPWWRAYSTDDLGKTVNENRPFLERVGVAINGFIPTEQAISI
jgi:hypothetical protein